MVGDEPISKFAHRSCVVLWGAHRVVVEYCYLLRVVELMRFKAYNDVVLCVGYNVPIISLFRLVKNIAFHII